MPARRLFAFALRDELPLDERGWTVAVHPSECGELDHSDQCAATTAVFIQRPATDSRWDEANGELTTVVDELLGVTRNGSDWTAHPLPAMISIAVASTPVTGNSDEFDAAFAVMANAVDALRIATQAPISPLTIERVWPVYLVLDEDEQGNRSGSNLVVVEHGIRGPGRANDDDLRQAEMFLAGGMNGDPVENLRYWLLGAKNDARVHGDHAGAILKAAASAEVLIKATAAMLIWEWNEYGTGTAPAWAVAGPGVLGLRPSKVLASVLAQALGGSWSSQHDHQPVGAWRTHVAQMRNRVIHRGYRPTADEVSDAMAAVDGLVGHIGDRLAAKANKFPRTAVITLGQSGLERRGAWGKVRATHAAETADWRAQYRAWTQTAPDDCDDD